MAILKDRSSGVWLYVIFALIGATSAPLLALFARFFPSSTSIYVNFLRSLEWETLCAGLLSLAGGLAVVAVTRDQVSNEKIRGFKTKFSEIIDARSHIVEVMKQLRDIERDLGPLIDEEKHDFLGSSEQAAYFRDKMYELCQRQSKEAFKVWIKASWPLPDIAVNALDNVSSRLRIRDIWELRRLQVEEMKYGPKLDDYGDEVTPFIGEGDHWKWSVIIVYSNIKIILKDCDAYLESAEVFLVQKARELGVSLRFS